MERGTGEDEPSLVLYSVWVESQAHGDGVSVKLNLYDDTIY